MVGEEKEKPLRADAERNRRRLLDAAESLFRERGLDVGVGEIAERAGVGRGTLFRNFPSKEHLIAAIVVERMQESVERGRAALEALVQRAQEAGAVRTDVSAIDVMMRVKGACASSRSFQHFHPNVAAR